MDIEQHVRSYADADSNPYTHANAYTDSDSNANANANANDVHSVGGRQDLHRWPGRELHRCYLQSAIDPHRLHRHQLESEGYPDLVDGRWNLQYDPNPDTDTHTDTDSDTNTDTDTDTDSDADSNAHRHEETSVSWLYACKLCQRLRLYPHG